MDAKIERFIKHLFATQPNLKDIIKTFQWCSRYNNGNSYLVDNQTKTIDFDNFTEWIYGRDVHSADSLSFSDDYAVLIEFKSGDPTTHEKKTQKLIDNVVEKINDSDDTLTQLYWHCFSEGNERIKQKFFLVVDSKKMGIDPLVSTLISLSLQENKNSKHRIFLEQVRPNLTRGIKHPEHYEVVDIWYSELFDMYVHTYKIKDMECLKKEYSLVGAGTR